jgi:prepilin-type processing-associated H-X9-DG protein
MTRASDLAKLLGAGATINDGTTITTADNTDQLTLISTDADANVGPNLNLFRNSGSPADDDVLGLIIYNGRNDNSQDVIYARQVSYIKDASDGTEDGQLTLQTMVAGTIRDRLNITPTEIAINEDSIDSDFRVESNGNANMLFVDGGNDAVGIGTSTDYGGQLNIETTGQAYNLVLACTDADANNGPLLDFYRNSSSPADGDLLGEISFRGRNDNSQDVNYGFISGTIIDASDGEEDGMLVISTMQEGTTVSRMRLQRTETVFNEDSKDIDFRVESDNDSSAFFVNGETGNTGFGTSTTPASISIYTNISSANNFDGVRLRNVSTSSNQYGGALFVGLLSGGIPQAQVRGPADGNGMLIFQTGSSETEHFRIAADGTLTATDTSIGSNSDSRLKKDIEDYTYDINNFKAFRTRTFEWINKEEHGNKTNCVGFVAQEVESTDTRWVDENQINDTSGDGTTNADWDLIPENEKGIRKSKTSKLGEKDAMYVSVIQQLITRIEALESA